MSNITVLNNGNHSIFQTHGNKLFSIQSGVSVDIIIITVDSFTVLTSQHDLYEFNSILSEDEKLKLLELMLDNTKILKLVIGKNDLPVWNSVLPLLVKKGVYVNKYGVVIKLDDYKHLKSKINNNSNPVYINYFNENEKVTIEDLMKELLELKVSLTEKGII